MSCSSNAHLYLFFGKHGISFTHLSNSISSSVFILIECSSSKRHPRQTLNASKQPLCELNNLLYHTLKTSPVITLGTVVHINQWWQPREWKDRGLPPVQHTNHLNPFLPPSVPLFPKCNYKPGRGSRLGLGGLQSTAPTLSGIKMQGSFYSSDTPLHLTGC